MSALMLEKIIFNMGIKFLLLVLYFSLNASGNESLKLAEISSDEMQGCWVSQKVIKDQKEIQDKFNQTLIYYPAQRKVVVIENAVQPLYSPIAKGDIIGLYSSAWTADYDIIIDGESSAKTIKICEKKFVVNGFLNSEGECILLELVLDNGKDEREWKAQYRRPRKYLLGYAVGSRDPKM